MSSPESAISLVKAKYSPINPSCSSWERVAQFAGFE
jgi:hypothetical protein